MDWHWPAGGPLDVTTEVAFEIAAAEPTLFVAVTSTRNVCPTSAELRRYVWDVTGVIEQSPPAWSQRRQRYENWIGLLPLQLPGSALSVWPSCGVPEIDGSFVFLGACSGAFLITSVAADCAVPAPSLFTAVTRTRSRWPTS